MSAIVDTSKYKYSELLPDSEMFDLENVVNRHTEGDIEYAKRAYHALIDASRQNAVVCTNLAAIYIQEKEYERAIDYLRMAIRVEPDYVDAYLKLGCTIELYVEGKLDEAIANYHKVLELKPDHPQVQFVLGNALIKQGKVDQAIKCFRQAIKTGSINLNIAHFNLGNLLMSQNHLKEAAHHFKIALDLDKSLNGALCKYWHMRMKMCDWSDHEEMKRSIAKAIREMSPIETPDVTNSIAPFSLVNIVDDPAVFLMTAEEYTRATTRNTQDLGAFISNHKHASNQIIKIAFLSADFYNHATAYLMGELFELIDHQQFDIHVFSFGRSEPSSIMRRRIESACTCFHDVSDKTDMEIAILIAALGIDIAVDLKGYTAECRPGILAYKPAPVQVNYLGYPGTMGAKFIDYLIADPYIIPVEEQANYKEKIVYLPDSYQVNDGKRIVHTEQPSRKECGLPENSFVFCCFNQSYKFTPEVFDVWMDLLKETPDSVLWLYESNQWANDNLRREAECRGVDPERLIFASQLAVDLHLARLQNADLFLDTYPCNAHTTASDALWVGLPLVTYSGRSFATRVAGSLLKAIDLEELITTNLNTYKALALELANNPEKLNAIKTKLQNNRDSCPLFDTVRYKNNLQRAFKHMMELYEDGSEAETFYVSDLDNSQNQLLTPEETSSQNDESLMINVAIIRPDGYVHSEAFYEVAETLFYSLNELGFTANITENTLIDDGINIILGANLLEEDDINLIPASSIIYNFEQVTDTSKWMTPALYDLFSKFVVWDYSKKNIDALQKLGITKNIHHVPVGYNPCLTRIPKSEIEDIDVLFYGSMNQRRQNILQKLKDAGLIVETLFGVYGTERDEYISRSKVIVNIHYYDSNIFEQVRVSYLLANKKAVVSECSDSTEEDEDIKSAVALVSYDQIVDKCSELVRSDELRKVLEEKGFEYIKTREAVHYLNEALIALNVDTDREPQPELPAKINIGSGKDFKADCLNIDISSNGNPDVVADVSDQHLIGQTVISKRFGEITFTENQFDEIIANDVLEHIPELVTAITNCLHLLKVGGQFKIIVPYDLSYGAWQDPTHVRAFNERSWLYYTDWYWYLGWKDARFDLTRLDFSLSAAGIKMQQADCSIEQILTQPRAVDSMSVVLTKRLLTDEEKTAGLQRMAGV